MKTKLNNWFAQNPELDGFLITKTENVYYMTEFWGSFGFVLILRSGETHLVTDGRYAEVATHLATAHNFNFQLFDSQFVDNFGTKISGKFACENSLSLGELGKFKKYFPNIKFSPQSQVWENLRRIKTADEIEKIITAQSHVDEILVSFFAQNLKAGITEQSLNFKLQQVLQSEGKHGLSFPSIVAFGENSSHAHHVSGARKLKFNDNILVDCGITHDRYCSDMTRNFVFGIPKDDYLAKYKFLRQAQEKTNHEIQAGASTKAIDAFCREQLGDEANYFTHSLGHGVGLEIHELPNLSPKTDFTLQADEVITNEPGLYYPGKFGIRIEDLVLVKEDHGEILSKTSRDLLSFGEDGNVQIIG